MFTRPRGRGGLRSALVGILSSALILTTAGIAPSAAAAPSRHDTLPPPAHAQGALSTSQSAFAQSLESKYVDPDRIYSADVRWWLGQASNTDEVLLEQIQHLYDGGFRGVELCMQNDSGAPAALYAYGSAMWTHKWNLMMNKLLDLGMSVYLTSGTNWSTSNVPGLDPDSQAAMQNLTLGTSTVAAGTNVTVLPVPTASVRRAAAKFVTAYAYKVVSGTAVDPNSYINLAPLITQGADVWTQNLTWTVPADGSYQIFAIWTEGTYQTSSPATTTSYATNYFDARGVQALRTFWEANYLSDPALVTKFEHGDVQLFMDSLEINPGTAGITWWSEDMAAQFQARKGYDIMPLIFLMYGLPQVNAVYNAYIPRAQGTYDLSGNANLREKTINDFLDVLTQMYRERMLDPLHTWLNSVGIKTRAQISYGRSFEISEPAMSVDYPEEENFNQYDQIDLWRLLTGATKLENKVLSSETGAELPQYATIQQQMTDAYRSYASGIQRMVFHVWEAEWAYGNYNWPGYFGGFYHPGAVHPYSRDYDEYNAHLGRIQQLVQTGKSRSDVGFIHNDWNQGEAFRAENNGTNPRVSQMNWEFAHMGVFYRSTELQDNGYTYDYFSPKFLFASAVSFNATTKTIEPAGYKALVLWEDWLDIAGAQRILDWAQQGLPVVLLPNAASRTPFNDGKDAQLAAIITQLKALPTTRVATVFDPPTNYFGMYVGGYHDNVMAMLQELGVYPYTGYAGANEQLMNQTRIDANGNEYVYLYNYCDGSYHANSLRPEIQTLNHGTTISTSIVENGLFIPYVIDAWTGRVTQVANYTWSGGKTIVPFSLDYNNVALLAFEKVADAPLHIVSTNAASSQAIAGGGSARATSSGTVSTQLSNGVAFSQPVTVPAAYDIANWNLTVQSWSANPVVRDLTRTETIDTLTTVNHSTSTVLTPISVTLPTLATWDNIPAIGKNVSGTGRYDATFNWTPNGASGAYLDMGKSLQGSMKVWINGQKVGGQVSTNPTKVKKDVGGVGKPTIDDGRGNQVPLVGKDLYTGGVSWDEPIIDVSPYLVNGQNAIAIEYNSSLGNLQLFRKAISVTLNSRSWFGNNQDYVSYGPVQAKIVPFVDVPYTLDTTTTVGATYDPTPYGKPTTVAATVATATPGGPVPTGTVQFSVDGAAYGSPVTLDAAGVAALPAISTLGIGTHDIRADYSGDATWLPSSGSGTHTIKKRLATTSAVTSAGPVLFGQPWSLTAAVNPENMSSGLQPTGTLQLMLDGVKLADGGTPLNLPISGGTISTANFTITITCTWPPLRCTITIEWNAASAIKAGNHGVRVVYSGDANYTGSTSPTYTQQVKKQTPPGIVVSAPPSPISAASHPTFTAAFTNPVAPAGSLTPATVQFLLDGTNLGAPVALAPDGTASFPVTWTLPTGSHTVKARYLGNADFLAVYAAPLTLKINP